MSGERAVWASKIGTKPGPKIVIKGYATPGREPKVGQLVEYRPARRVIAGSGWGGSRGKPYRNEWRDDYAHNWKRGIVTEIRHGMIFLDKA